MMIATSPTIYYTQLYIVGCEKSIGYAKFVKRRDGYLNQNKFSLTTLQQASTFFHQRCDERRAREVTDLEGDEILYPESSTTQFRHGVLLSIGIRDNICSRSRTSFIIFLLCVCVYLFLRPSCM